MRKCLGIEPSEHLEHLVMDEAVKLMVRRRVVRRRAEVFCLPFFQQAHAALHVLIVSIIVPVEVLKADEKQASDQALLSCGSPFAKACLSFIIALLYCFNANS
jgi:hypothetical protein